MTKARPSIWLATLEIIWRTLVMGMAGAKNLETLYVLRFFIGMLEASAYPGILTLLGNWYTPQELGKRSSIFISSAMIAQMFSGYLQAALYTRIDSWNGFVVWRWLFIFDGILGIPTFIYGVFAVPDNPTNTKARWITSEHKAMTVARIYRVGREPPGHLTWKTFREVFSMWPVYLFSTSFTAQVLGIRIYNYFTIYPRDVGHSVEETNLIPTAAFAFQAVLTLVYTCFSDAIQMRAPVIYVASSISLIGCISLSVYPEKNPAAMMAGWFLTYGETGALALILSYVNEILSFSTEHHLVIIGVVETCAFVMNAWVILFVYPSGDAPHFSIGYEMAAAFFVLEIVSIGSAWFCAVKWKPVLPAEDEAGNSEHAHIQ
ncbi:putative major facilitator superfamily transporter protein [Seiridium unicorne]|uniref:Major facilitator superfamily transporter protein n=1 Tax=Seiridium unicorne TaxID=138068 RepID=A0ABR2V8D9_9PEZI